MVFFFQSEKLWWNTKKNTDVWMGIVLCGKTGCDVLHHCWCLKERFFWVEKLTNQAAIIMLCTAEDFDFTVKDFKNLTSLFFKLFFLTYTKL